MLLLKLTYKLWKSQVIYNTSANNINLFQEKAWAQSAVDT